MRRILCGSLGVLLLGGPTTAADVRSQGAGSGPNPIYYVYVLSEGPEWATGVPANEQEGFDRHYAHLVGLYERGALVMAGPFKDETGGGMDILRAGDLDEARELVADDPWVEAGLLRVEALRPWLIGLGGAGPAAGHLAHHGHRTARVLSKEVAVRASLDQVWACWTTNQGLAAFFSPESNIELRVGGPYELYMSMTRPDADGKRGTQGCKVLSYLPKEMLSFEWNFPPKVRALRRSGAKTHVVLRFSDLGDGRVKVRFDQLGWGEGAEWDQGYSYFDRAWDQVFDALKKHLEGEGSGTSVP